MLKSIVVKNIQTINNGVANLNLLNNPSCFILNASAIVSLALLNAVSPLVIGQQHQVLQVLHQLVLITL